MSFSLMYEVVVRWSFDGPLYDMYIKFIFVLAEPVDLIEPRHASFRLNLGLASCVTFNVYTIFCSLFIASVIQRLVNLYS